MLDATIAPGSQSVADEALAGLLAARKTLPPKFFYDAEGVRLFGEITRLPEYYLTRTELALLTRRAPAIAALAPAGCALIEWGASDEAKACHLLEAPGANFECFVPVDVAAEALAALQARLRSRLPQLRVLPVCADFTSAHSLPAALGHSPRMGFFPGSTIGNFEPAEAIALLARMRAALGPAGLLVLGADLRKSPDLLLPAYNDAAGVTAAFNLNLLTRLNREAGANFDPARFRHSAIWNAAESRIEMHLESLCAQTIHVAGHDIGFAKGETIHTENSYKHSADALAGIAEAAGWTSCAAWMDDAGLFTINVLQAAG